METIPCPACRESGWFGGPAGAEGDRCPPCGGIGDVCERCLQNGTGGCDCERCEACGSFDVLPEGVLPDGRYVLCAGCAVEHERALHRGAA